MPIYEYRCQQCGQQFELLVRGSEKPECPHCGRSKLEKLLSLPVAHVASPQPACPAREVGACGMGACPSGGCGMMQ